MTRERQQQGRTAQAIAARAGNGLTERQVEAIKGAMHAFVEEDLERGVPPWSTRICTACRCLRLAAGFVAYDGLLLCNECATEYELSHARGLVSTTEEFLAAAGSRRASEI